MAVLKFIASTNGRIFRVVIGLVFVMLAVLNSNLILASIGLVPIASGIFDFCLIAPLFGQPLAGKDMRAK